MRYAAAASWSFWLTAGVDADAVIAFLLRGRVLPPASRGERGFHRPLRVPEPQRLGTANSRSASPAVIDRVVRGHFSSASSSRVSRPGLLVPPLGRPAGQGPPAEQEAASRRRGEHGASGGR